jgi:hypothetical protein
MPQNESLGLYRANAPSCEEVLKGHGFIRAVKSARPDKDLKLHGAFALLDVLSKMSLPRLFRAL